VYQGTRDGRTCKPGYLPTACRRSTLSTVTAKLRTPDAPTPAREVSGTLPDDIRELAAHRLAITAGIFAAFAIVEGGFSHGMEYVRSSSYPTTMEKWDLIGVALISTTSIAAFVALRRQGWLTSTRLRLGVAYLIAISYLISLTDHADHFWQGGHALHGIPVVTMMILIFPVIVPMRPLKALWIGLAMAATGPIALFTLVSALEYETPHTGALLDSFPFLAALLAAALARIVHQLGLKLREARKLGQYTLEQKLGEGGMGVVYTAHHALMRRPTAIKLVPLEKAGQDSLARFEREVQLTSKLTHPHTITIYDYGRTPEGVFYYAMELLDGATLGEVVEASGALPAGRVIRVLHQIAGALSEAHGVGLIHRDIKPANIMLADQGGIPDEAKILDFGLVKELEDSSTASLTKADSVTGTPQYLAPEAVTAPDSVDARSDIYSLGAVGYFLLTGEHVFTGATIVEVCAAHLHEPPVPPSERLGRAVPADLEQLVLDCLAKDPQDRPQSAASLRKTLGGLEAYGSWSEEDARAWWNNYRENVSCCIHDRAIPRTDATIEIDLLGRATRADGP
jgi:hypothetical protein